MKKFWPTSPDPKSICIEDIAHATARICRYTGHVQDFYSVAEHCVLMSRAIPQEFRKIALLHDASEAYMNDIASPIKQSLPDYKKIEDGVQKVIAEKFGIPYPFPAIVHEYDKRILMDERAQVIGEFLPGWSHEYESLGITIPGWGYKKAEREYLKRWEQVKNDD